MKHFPGFRPINTHAWNYFGWRGRFRLLVNHARFLPRTSAWRCMDCYRRLWPWQSRCGPRHSSCKHRGDLILAARNGYHITWDCSYCGRPITEARP